MARTPTHKRSLASALAEIDRRLDADDLLTADEKQVIRDKAREEVARRRKERAEEAYLKAAIKEEERAFDPVEQWEDVIIDLAPYAAFIALDGVQYFHGLTYTVTRGQAATIADVCARTWEHQREIKGERRRGVDIAWSAAREQRGGVRISPADEGASAQAINTREQLLSSARI